MKSKISLGSLLLIPIILFLILLSPQHGYTGNKNSIIRSTRDHQTSVSLTIYNKNFALVKEKRNLTLSAKEKQEILFEEVPIQIEPDTVFVKTEIPKFQILEQKFLYDLISQEKLLEQYVGKTVKIIEKNPKTGDKNILEAELVSYNNNQPVYKIMGEIYLGYPGTVILPKIPEQLTARPTLEWLVKNTAGEIKGKPATISYLTRGLNWKANYVLQLANSGSSGDLFSWVTIENQSGALFQDAQIKLVAGDVQRIEDAVRPVVRRMKAAESIADVEQSPFKEESFSEYHLYTLAGTSTLNDQQTTQISFIQASQVPVQKEFVFLGEGIYNRRQDTFSDNPQPVNVYLKLDNKKEKNLGIALPQGSIKVYQRDQSGSIEFIGEDLLQHTPEGEIIRLQIGQAFDVVGVQKQMELEKISNRAYESSWQVNLRNRKNEKIVVRVIEPVGGEWKIINTSHSYKKLEARKIEFSVPLSAKGEETLTYRIRVEY